MSPTTVTTQAATEDRAVERPQDNTGPGYIELFRRIFGVDALAGDPASLQFAQRDARARAGSLSDESSALNALGTAEKYGDELLARAIAGRAYAVGRWGSVLAAFLAARPALVEDLAALQQSAEPVPPAMPAAATLTRQVGNEPRGRMFRMDDRGGVIEEIDAQGRPLSPGLPRGGSGAIHSTIHKD